ncbi:MAG: DUF4861 family protein [Phycisphaerae bacterium]|nr:DUF4861 family protein [Phycisphaerae bacterium]
MFQSLKRLAAATLCALMASVAPALAQDAKQQLFEKVFGDAVKLDPAMVAKVRAGKPGQRFYVDRNGDGKNDEVWYIDTAVRHMPNTRPVLVRVIDEDGDLDKTGGGDLDSDLYVADWKADGTVDCVLDYQDTDGDNDLDEMGLYYFAPRYGYIGGPALLVWWGRDDGDDNLLWYDVSYTYNQSLCQYRSHFSGDEVLVEFGIKQDLDKWVPIFEDPFLFYDPDGDRCSEVVLRISGQEDLVESIRYSFDVDDDAHGRRTHDYDFSITALAPGSRWFTKAPKGVSELKVPKEMLETAKVRGIPTGPWMKRDCALKWVNETAFPRAVLTWDEMNANTDKNVKGDPHERWEGIIAHPSEHFPQIGGPPCSPLNKRNEIAVEGVKNLRLYYDPTDRRLHLIGATEGWLHVDYDLDGKADAKTTYLDDDKDGLFDRRQLDVDADGTVDFDWKMKGKDVQVFELTWQPLKDFYRPLLVQVLIESQTFIDVAKAALAKKTGSLAQSDLETYWLTKLESWQPLTHLGRWMRKTPAGARLYVDLLRDRLLCELKKHFADSPAWNKLEQAYAAGDYAEAAKVVKNELEPGAVVADPRAFGSFAKRIALTFDNAARPQRDEWAVAIPVKRIRAIAADFNPGNCAVVASERCIGWREVPHQVDEIDPTVGKELSFIIDVRADTKATYYLYYSPTGKRDATFAKKTSTAEDWVPPNIGWESNRCAYRAYWGQFDFFGKKTEDLIYPTIGNKSYHSEVAWGIDALHVGDTSGLGGLTLYQGDKAYRVFNPSGKGDVKFVKRQLISGPVRAAIDLTASNIVPDKPDLTVHMLCIIYAERQETEMRVTVSGAVGEVVLASGRCKLPREEAFADLAKGYAGVWGYQEAVIDEIGMGLVVSPKSIVGRVDLPDEKRLKIRTADGGKMRCWLIGDWRRGRQHPVAVNARVWQENMEALAGLLLNDATLTIGQVEELK